MTESTAFQPATTNLVVCDKDDLFGEAIELPVVGWFITPATTPNNCPTAQPGIWVAEESTVVAWWEYRCDHPTAHIAAAA